MARTLLLNQLSNESRSEYDHATLTQPEWLAIQNHQLSNHPNTNELGTMPNNQVTSIFSFSSMQTIGNYSHSETELQHMLNDWSDSQTIYNHDWGEYQMTHAYLDLNDQPNTFLTTQNLYSQSNLDIDTLLNDLFPLPSLPETSYSIPDIPISPM